MRKSVLILSLFLLSTAARADENLFGYVKGAETLPEGSFEVYQFATYRAGKGTGTYHAWDLKTEFEYGFTHRFNASVALGMQSISTNGLLIDGYLPQEGTWGLRPSGLELSMKYNFLSPAKDDFGISAYYSIDYDWRDRHSGQGKQTFSNELRFLFQKYFLEGELIWVGNLGTEATHATRAVIDGLPDGFDWPTEPEMEIELLAGSGLTYRFAPNFFAGAEFMAETEFETEIGLERWSLFAGPTLHYGGRDWWTTLTWFPQIRGGGEKYEGQEYASLHLIEKSQNEFRLKFGYNF